MIETKIHAKEGDSNEQTAQETDFTAQELQLLEQCEITIKDGIKHFLAVGQAMSTIRQKRLYRIKGFKNFETYCNDEWKINRRHADRLIEAFALEENLSPMGLKTKPVLKNERQARKYRKLSDEEKDEVKKALADGEEMEDALDDVADKKKGPSDLLKLRGWVNKISLLLPSLQRDEANAVCEPLWAWRKEYVSFKQKQDEKAKEDLAWLPPVTMNFGRVKTYEEREAA